MKKKKCLDILNQSTRHLFENIFLLFDFMWKKDSLYNDDYRISVTLESMLEKNQHMHSLLCPYICCKKNTIGMQYDVGWESEN